MQMDGGQLHQITSSNSTYVSPLPPAVANVPKEDIRGFLHHKRVGNYLLGRTLGEGSFAKVKEGMHVTTGEKVSKSANELQVIEGSCELLCCIQLNNFGLAIVIKSVAHSCHAMHYVCGITFFANS